MNTVFQEYSQFYDLIYSEKNYEKESSFVLNLLREHNPKVKTLLDLGCGTAKHDGYLLNEGLEVWGVDHSKTMLGIASHNYPGNKVHFIEGDVTKIRLEKKFDAVISLFHVLSYQTTNLSMLDFFKTVESHLEENGVAVIDFWYGPGVLHLKPEKREKVFTNNKFDITRISTPTEIRDENVVDIELKLEVLEKNNNKYTQIKENHRMRYFFSDEIARILLQTNLELIETKEWLSRKELTQESWSAYVLLKKDHK
jgi:SAM-dependent methyltransferase